MTEDRKREELRIISILNNHPLLYRLALAWPDLEKEITPAPEGAVNEWSLTLFSFEEWSSLADVAPQATLRGFDRLKSYGIILPDGTLHPAADKFFGVALQRDLKIKSKKPPKQPEQPGE